MPKNKLFWALLAGLVLGLTYGLVNKAWPDENKEDLIYVITYEAENWPVVGESRNLGTIGKFHKDPSNPDRALLSIWFFNKDAGRHEMFAKMLFLWSEQKSDELGISRKAALKNEKGEWSFGDYLRSSDAKLNGEKAVAFRLFGNQDKNNPVGLRVFLLKDLAGK